MQEISGVIKAVCAVIVLYVVVGEELIELQLQKELHPIDLPSC